MAVSRKKKEKKDTENSRAPVNDDTLLEQSIKNVEEWFTFYNQHIQRARDFLTFLYVDQWDVTIRKARESISRPCMQFNKLVPIIRSLLGEQRENSPALTVRGVGKDVKQDEVDVREGLLRQIHYDSDADIVYQIASKHAMECGWGAARVCTRYENENSFDQCIYLEPIVDFQCAFWDPVSQLPDKSDGDYCGVYITLSKKHFERVYPDVENPQSLQPGGDGQYFQWNTIDTITICEKYYKEWFTKTIVILSDGNTVDKKEAKEIMEKQEKFMADNPDYELTGFKPLTIENEREVKDYKIKYIKFIKNKILERKDYPGKLLPIVCFEGDSVVIDGERIPIPFVQDGIDNQKMINYILSELAYMVLRSRKETVMGTAANFEGYEDIWRNPDQVQGPLLYNFDKVSGKPEFIDPPQFNASLIQLYQSIVTDLQQNLGWFDEAQGNETNAVSGIAIGRRQQASKKGANVYNDNWKRGIKQCGKVVLDLFPHIYDSNRVVMIRGQDNSSKAVQLNQNAGYKMVNGNIEPHVVNDMSFGKYDIEVRVDGSYDMQTAEAMDTLIRLAQINPAIGNLIPDLIAEVSGLENSQQLVSRLKTLLPPQILAQEEGKPLPPPQPPPPDPSIELQREKNQLMMAQNETRKQQLVLDEQKLMVQEKIAGMDHDASFAKAQAEIAKSHNEKDIALLDHASRLVEAHSKADKPTIKKPAVKKRR